VPNRHEAFLISKYVKFGVPAEIHELVASREQRSILKIKYISTCHRAFHLSGKAEGMMRVQETMFWALRRRGVSTGEGSSSLRRIGWTQVLLCMDRLSRNSKHSLIPVRRCEYHISITGLLRR